MTDVSAQPTPAPVEPSAADDWNSQWNNFMGHSFGDTPPDELENKAPEGDAPASSQTPPTNGEPAPVEGAPPVTPQPQGTNTTPTPNADGTQQAGTETPKAGEEIDPATLLAMAGAAPAPAPTPEPKPEGGAPAAPEEFRPFANPIALPQPTLAALFEAEDTETRAAAIGGVLQAMGNTIVQIVEARLKDTHLPGVRAAAVEDFHRQASARQVQTEFYFDFPYLEKDEYKQVVAKAFEITAKNNPELTFAQAKTKVGNLARAFIKQTTGVDPAPTNQAPPAPSAPPAPKPPGFVASGARPAGTGDAPDPSSPGAVLDELLGSGF